MVLCPGHSGSACSTRRDDDIRNLMMDQSVQSILNPVLDPGESLLWSGQPRSGIRLRSQDFILIPFSLLWGGFAIFWECMAVNGSSKAHGTPGAVFPLFGL